MGGINRGKQFEDKIRGAFQKVPNISIIRLLDPQNGYAGVRNVCDFIVYHYPHQYMIECKSCHGNTLPFTNITENQWSGLLAQSSVFGIIPGYMIWFIDRDETIFVTAKDLFFYRADGNRKSLNIKDVENGTLKCIRLTGKKLRILYEYDMEKFFEEVENGNDSE